MKKDIVGAWLLALILLVPASGAAEQDRRAPGDLPDLETLTRVPVGPPSASVTRDPSREGLDEATWRKRFRTLRTKIERKERLLALKRAELYDKIEKGQTEKKTRRFAIEGFVINTEKTGDEPRYIDPLEKEIHEQQKDLDRLRRDLRELEFEASVAGVPKVWRR